MLKAPINQRLKRRRPGASSSAMSTAPEPHKDEREVRAALDDKLGSLREGLLADMVAVAGDPAPDISRVRDVRLVMQGGRVVRAVP